MSSQYDSELHKFVIGETRVDGWKSQWKMDLEQWQKDNPSQLRPKPVVKAKAPKPRSERKPSVQVERRKCNRCDNLLRSSNKSGRCRVHRGFNRPPAIVRTCELCTNRIQSNNKSGRCTEHSYRGKLFSCVACTNRVKIQGATCRPCVRAQNKLRTCQHEGCAERLNSRNSEGLCRWHGRHAYKCRNIRREAA